MHLALGWSRPTPAAPSTPSPQGTATEWLKRSRSDLSSPVTVACPGLEPPRALGLAREEHYRFVVIDLPPHATAQIAWLLHQADLLVGSLPDRPPPNS